MIPIYYQVSWFWILWEVRFQWAGILPPPDRFSVKKPDRNDVQFDQFNLI